MVKENSLNLKTFDKDELKIAEIGVIAPVELMPSEFALMKSKIK
jgi:hypothetical protein